MKAVIGVITGLALIFIGLTPLHAADPWTKLQQLQARHNDAMCKLEAQIKAEMPRMKALVQQEEFYVTQAVQQVTEKKQRLQALEAQIDASRKQRIQNEQQRLNQELQKLGTKSTQTVNPFGESKKGPLGLW